MRTKDKVRIIGDVLRWRPCEGGEGCIPGIMATTYDVVVVQVAYGDESLTAELTEPVDTDDLILMMDDMARILVTSAAEFEGSVRRDCDDILDDFGPGSEVDDDV